MLFRRGKGHRSVMTVAMVAGLAFIALAIYGWDLPVAKAGQFLLITLILVSVLVAAAFLAVWLWNTVKAFFNR